MRTRGIELWFRSYLLFLLTFFVILLSTGCLYTEQSVIRNTNQSNQLNGDLPRDGDITEIDQYELAEEHCEKLIDEISRKLELFPLSKTRKSDELELRLWTNFSLGEDKLLIVRSSESNNHAYFFEINRHTDPIRFRRENFASSRSGWSTLLSEVNSQLTAPKALVRDPHFSLDRDEGVIFLEIFDKGEYHRVLYGQNTSFEDGKRLVELCDYLADEFGVNMNCRRV